MASIDASSFRRALLRWYRGHRRDLPWRQTCDPYAILVSEMMLQQTQVATVLPYYERWLKRFPDFARLAAAAEADVLHAWQGLGYYARARNLHAAAQAVVRQHGGGFPRDTTAARALPGLGRYTANAVATFAFDESVPLVEANIARLCARLLDLQLPIDASAGRERLWDFAATLVPQRGAGEFNSALMDLGALVCIPRQPKCGECPVRSFCRATDPARLPLKKKRPAVVELTEYHAFAVRGDRILLEQSSERWRGMWILPRFQPNETSRALYTAEFPFTHHRITLSVHSARLPAGAAQRWFPTEAIEALPLPSPHRRALAHLLAGR